MKLARYFVALALLALARSVLAADPVAELGSFSIFQNADLAQLAQAPKTAHGPPLSTGRYLSVQSCYIAPGSPAQHLEALRRWSPANHRELKVMVQEDIPGGAGPNAFAKIKTVPESGPVKTFVNDTVKMSNDLELSQEEAAKFNAANANGGLNGGVGDFWMGVLSGRAKAFTSGGSAGLPAYDRSGSGIRVNDELKGLLSEQGKIRHQFDGFLGSTGIGRGAGSIKPSQYWMFHQVEDTVVAALGAFFSRSNAEGVQAADVAYYASSGYFAGLTLYQMWPAAVNGQTSTLVWRADMTSAASLGGLRGVEKLGSESAMMKNVGRSINFLLLDSK